MNSAVKIEKHTHSVVINSVIFECSERQLSSDENLKVPLEFCIVFGCFVVDNNTIQCQYELVFVSVKQAESGEGTPLIIFGRAGYTKR